MLQDSSATFSESSQLLRLQERIDRQLACARRDIADSVESVAQKHAQESVELLRSQLLVNHGVLQKDVAALQTSVGEVRLRLVAVGQEGEEQRGLLASAQSEWEQALKNVHEQLQRLRAEFADLLESTAARISATADETARSAAKAAEDAARSAAIAEAASLRDELQADLSLCEALGKGLREEINRIGTHAESAHEVGERAVREGRELGRGLHEELSRIALHAESAREIGEHAARDSLRGLRAHAAELAKDRESWTAGLANLKECFSSQLAELSSKTDARLEEARSSADVQLSETRSTALLVADAKEVLFAHVDEQVLQVKDAMAKQLEECKHHWDQYRQLTDTTVANSVREFAGIVESLDHAIAEKVQKVEDRARSMIEDVAQGYRLSQSEVHGEVHAEAAALKKWMDVGLEAHCSRWQCAAVMLEKRHHELQETQRELHAQSYRMHDELTCSVGASLAETRECERSLQKVSSEAAAQAQQLADVRNQVQSDVQCSRADITRLQELVQKREDQRHAEQNAEFRELTAAMRHIEERTAWLCGRRDSDHDAAKESHSALQRRQQALEDCHLEQQQLIDKQVELLRQDVNVLRHTVVAEEHYAATCATAEEMHMAKQELLKKWLEERMSELAIGLHDCASGQRAKDDAMERLSDNLNVCEKEQHAMREHLQHLKDDTIQQQSAQAQLWNASESGMQQIKQSLKLCEQDQLCMHDQLQQGQDATQQLRHSLKLFEQEQHATHQHLKHDITQHLTHFRSRLYDSQEVAEEKAQTFEKIIRELKCQLSKELAGSERRQHELHKEQHDMAAQFTVELGASEARVLNDQRSILAQVNEMAKTQETHEMRAQRCSKRNQARHMEIGEALEELRKDALEARQRLLGDVASEQASLALSFQRQVREAENVAVARGTRESEAATQTLSKGLHQELFLARRFHDDQLGKLQARIEVVGRQTEEAARREFAKVAAASAMDTLQKAENSAAACIALEVRRSQKEVQEVQSTKHDLFERGHAEALAEISACRDACFLATQRAASEHAAAERSNVQRALTAEEGMRAEIKALHGELVQHSSRQEPRLFYLQEAVARLEEDGGPHSKIAGAAAAAASNVRDEVLQQVDQLRERLEAVDDQMLFLRDEVAPDVLRSFLQPTVVQCSERAATDQLARFRKDWGSDIEWRLDCVAECLQALYSKVGLSAHGTLASLRQDVFLS